MKSIVTQRGGDCLYYVWCDGPWCVFPRGEDNAVDPFCEFSCADAPPCPIKDGVCISLGEEQSNTQRFRAELVAGERGRIVNYLRTLADVHQKIAEETRTMSTEEESWVQVQSAMQYLISKSLRAVADRIEAEDDKPTALFSEE